MKKLLLLLFCHFSLFTMQVQEQTIDLEGHSILIRHKQKHFIFAMFQPDNLNYVSKDLQKGQLVPTTKYLHLSDHGIIMHLRAEELDQDKINTLNKAIDKFEKTVLQEKFLYGK